MASYKVLVVDDHAVFRDGLVRIIAAENDRRRICGLPPDSRIQPSGGS